MFNLEAHARINGFEGVEAPISRGPVSPGPWSPETLQVSSLQLVRMASGAWRGLDSQRDCGEPPLAVRGPLTALSGEPDNQRG